MSHTRMSTRNALLSMAAVSTLALSACAGDELGAEGSTEDEDTAQTETAETDDTGTEDTSEEDAETQQTDETLDGDGPQEPYGAVDTVMSEYPDAVVGEFDTDGFSYDFTIYDGEVEWELEVDRDSLEIIDTEQDDVDSDDQRKAESVEIEFSEALRTAAEEGDGIAAEADLDDDNGAVVWEINLDNGTEVYVDVATGEVVNVDS